MIPINFNEKLTDEKKSIDAFLIEYMKPEEADQYPKEIYEAMGYSVFNSGKRLRPLLTIAACEAVSDLKAQAYPYACALELIHTYSLIHDDLPAMDDDDYRRGRLTSHKVFGEAMAILAGDALLNKSFEIMSEDLLENFSKQKLKAMNVIAAASGAKGMIGGQVVDILAENKNVEKDILIYMHEHKTAALIQAAVVAGALIGGSDEKSIFELSDGAMKLGLAFQIQDDILDVVSTQEVLGKQVKKDAEKNKTTYVSLFGLEKAKEDYEALSLEAIEIFSGFKNRSSFLYELAKSLMHRLN